MSDRAREVVKWYSQSKNTARLLLYMIAEFAHLDGSGAYPSMSTLCHITGMSLRNVQRLLKELEDSRELSIARNTGPNKTHVFKIELDFIMSHTTESSPEFAPVLSDSSDKLSFSSENNLESLSGERQPVVGDDNLSPQQNNLDTEVFEEPYKNLIREPDKVATSATSATPRSPKKAKGPPTVSLEFRAEMYVTWSPPHEPSYIDEIIDLALAHESAKKYDPPDGYVKNWLRREFARPTSNNGNRPARAPVGDNRENYDFGRQE